MPNESNLATGPVLVGAGVLASPLKRTLSSQLARLAARFANRPVRLGELTDVLQLRGYNALLLFLAFPFVTPVPLPGVSTPFGLVIALLGRAWRWPNSPGCPSASRPANSPNAFSPSSCSPPVGCSLAWKNC